MWDFRAGRVQVDLLLDTAETGFLVAVKASQGGRFGVTSGDCQSDFAVLLRMDRLRPAVDGIWTIPVHALDLRDLIDFKAGPKEDSQSLSRRCRAAGGATKEALITLFPSAGPTITSGYSVAVIQGPAGTPGGHAGRARRPRHRG